jgi:phosphatidylinositol alpha 1,6-mannosyltransferase
MTALRIAIVTESFLPSVNGVSRSVDRVARHLIERGHEAMIIAPGHGPDTHHGARVERLRAIPMPICPEFPVGLPTRRVRRLLEDFAPDVVHLASPIAVGAYGAVAARALELPTVAIFQTDVAGFATHYRLGTLAGPIWRWLQRVHADVDRTLAPSVSSVRELRRLGIPRVHRWARGVDLEAFAPHHRRRPPTQRVGVARVGYIGRLAAEKGVDRLAVIQGLPDCQMVVVGDGHRRRQLERQLPEAEFLGRLGGNELSRAFADLDVFVHTGVHETFCQTVQEALASGVPVVAPASGGPLDQVRHGDNGLLWRPDRPSDIREHVRQLIADPQRRAAMGVAARRGVTRNSWTALGDQLIRHYRAVTAQRALHPAMDRKEAS